MTTTINSQAALLFHRERIQDALRSATSRPASDGGRRIFPRLNRSPLLRLA
jgi:hypothetical protein